MKRTFIAAAVLSLAFAVPVFAADYGQPQQGQTMNFDQKKAEILKMIDARAAGIRDERSCVQAAKTLDDLKVCRDNRDKVIAEMKGRGPSGGQTPPQGH